MHGVITALTNYTGVAWWLHVGLGILSIVLAIIFFVSFITCFSPSVQDEENEIWRLGIASLVLAVIFAIPPFILTPFGNQYLSHSRFSYMAKPAVASSVFTTVKTIDGSLNLHPPADPGNMFGSVWTTAVTDPSLFSKFGVAPGLPSGWHIAVLTVPIGVVMNKQETAAVSVPALQSYLTQWLANNKREAAGILTSKSIAVNVRYWTSKCIMGSTCPTYYQFEASPNRMTVAIFYED